MGNKDQDQGCTGFIVDATGLTGSITLEHAPLTYALERPVPLPQPMSLKERAERINRRMAEIEELRAMGDRPTPRDEELSTIRRTCCGFVFICVQQDTVLLCFQGTDINVGTLIKRLI